MKLFCLSATIVALSFGMSLHAQTQQGYVKTLGRPNQKGMALSGVSIRAKGAHNAVLSNSQGIFSMSLPGKKNGESYQLQQVQKQGYELSEQGVLGRNYAFSDKVSLTITMVNSRQLQADKQRIENKAYEVAERNYKSRLAALEKQRDANSITIENYREQLQELQNRFDKYQSLIEGLADHYAHVDYDNLDEAERTINLCIENGDLERADSLLQQLGVYNRVEEIHRHLQSGEKLMAEANQDMAAVMKQQDKDAEYLYQLYTIALAKFDNDKAGFYIETRAELDTTNVDWQEEAAKFFSEYRADYPKSMILAQRAIRVAERIYGSHSEQIVTAYLTLGAVYEESKMWDLSLGAYQKGYDICSALYSEENILVAECLSQLGGMYGMKGQYPQAMDYHRKALAIRSHILPDNHQDIAQSLFNIGYVEVCMGQFANGLQNLQKSLDILITLYGENYIHVADDYHNIGYIYIFQQNYNLAIEYLQKGLEIRKRLLGDKHPDVSESYNALGSVYYNMQNFQQALSYYQQALSIRLVIFGEKSQPVAICYNNIGNIMGALDNYPKQLEYLQKSLEIQKVCAGEEHPEVGVAYLNVAIACFGKGNYSVALENALKARAIMEKALGKNHPNTIKCYDLLGGIYNEQGDYAKALECLLIVAKDYERRYGPEHPDTKYARKNVDAIKEKMSNNF